MSCCVVLPTNAERARSPVECHRLGTARHRDCDVADSGEALCGPLSGEDQPADECADGECVDHEPGSHLPALLFPIGRVGAMPLAAMRWSQPAFQSPEGVHRRAEAPAGLTAGNRSGRWRPTTSPVVPRTAAAGQSRRAFFAAQGRGGGRAFPFTFICVLSSGRVRVAPGSVRSCPMKRPASRPWLQPSSLAAPHPRSCRKARSQEQPGSRPSSEPHEGRWPHRVRELGLPTGIGHPGPGGGWSER